VAMDVKSAFEPDAYSAATGIPVKQIKPMLDKIMATRDLLMESGSGPQPKIDHEFRTTVVDGIHKPSDFTRIAESFSRYSEEHPGSSVKAYYLQAYRDSEGQIDPAGLCVPSREFLNTCMENLSYDIPSVQIRGEE